MRKYLLYSLLAGILVGALSYWFNDYDKIRVLGVPIFMIMSGCSLISGFLLNRAFNKPIPITLLTTLGVFISVFLRVLVDYMQDPSTHSLLGIELIMTLVLSLPFVLIGAAISRIPIFRES